MALPNVKQFVWMLLGSILLGHFFISLGRQETIWFLLTEAWYFLDLFFTSLINLAVIGYLVVLHLSLDRHHPMRDNLAKRLLYQGLLGVVVPAFLAYSLTFIYMEFVLDQRFLDSPFLLYEFPIAIIVIVTINLLLVIVTLLKAPVMTMDERKLRQVFLLGQGDKTIPVSVVEIACFSKQGDYCLVMTFDNKQFVSSHMLDEVENELDPDHFFRANRQFIINRRICEYFSADRSGKISLNLREPVNQTISVSQKRSTEFRSWIGKF